MATFTSLGIGSGLDLNGIVNKMVALERQPLRQLQQQASAIQNRISLYGQIRSQLSAVADAATALGSSTAWSALSAGVSPAQGLAVALDAGGGARAGSWQVQVDRLATGQALASAALDAQQGAGSGTLTIETGTWSGTRFSADSAGTALTVPISAANNTPSAIADAINAASGASGPVLASTITDASGTRLVITSRGTGAASGFRIGVTAAPDDGLQRLAYPPATAPDAVTPGTGMTRTREAGNAQIQVDGVSLSSSSNRLDGAIAGLSLQLTQTTSAPVSVTVHADTESRRTQINTFVEAYNTLSRTLSSATAYDAATKTAGPLQADRTAIGLQQALRTALRGVREGGSYSRLSDVGITQARDGTLAIDARKLDNALANGSALGELFHASGTAGRTDGLFVRLRGLVQQALRSDDGSVTQRTDALQAAVRRNEREQDRVNDRAERVQARLVAQYSALDKSMSSLNALNGYVSQQISAWNRSSDP